MRKEKGFRKEASEGKMIANWEGPYRVVESLQNGAYWLESINGKNLPKTWNSSHLWKFYVQILWKGQSVRWNLFADWYICKLQLLYNEWIMKQ